MRLHVVALEAPCGHRNEVCPLLVGVDVVRGVIEQLQRQPVQQVHQVLRYGVLGRAIIAVISPISFVAARQ